MGINMHIHIIACRILSRELNIPMEEITKSGGASKLIVGVNKDSMEGGAGNGAL